MPAFVRALFIKSSTEVELSYCITKGLSNSPSAIIYKLFHYAQSLLLHFGYYLQP